ncbi:MAG: MopE-related protein [Bradymonadaceae bacterium]
MIVCFTLVFGLFGCSDDTGSNTPAPGNNGGDKDTGLVDTTPNNNEIDDVGEPDGNGDDADVFVEPPCDPSLEECPCLSGQFRLCSSAADPLSLPPNSLCRTGVQRCFHGEWEDECHGEYTPDDGVCEPDEESLHCDGIINERGECVEGPTGDPADPNVLCEGVENPEIGDPCSCEVPADGEEFLRKLQHCYTGALDTLGVGTCVAGWRDCQPDGTWGPCNDEVTPQAEVCGDGLDNSCNGKVDDGCETCPQGFENCDNIDDGGVITISCPDGSQPNACGGCYEPEPEEICTSGFDDDCNGQVGEGCPCTGTSRQCYIGDKEVAGVGACNWGTQHCLGEFWGPCTGSVLPTTELCGPDGTGNGTDNNCNGIVDDGCGCTEGATRSCGTSTGTCEPGLQTCSSNTWGPCEGATGPTTEVCDGQDNNCNGITDDGLLNACGTCGDSCYLHPASPATSGILDEGAEFISATADDNPQDRDGLTLARRNTFPPYLWAANTVDGTVSKFNTETLEEEGRYWVGVSPSRTAVDLDGNTWVIGRNDGRVTKILWDTTSCPGNNTSTRDPGTGMVSQVNSAADPLADDCVVYSARPSYDATLPATMQRQTGRGLALTPDGRVWVGYSDQSAAKDRGAVQAIDPHTFAVGDVFPSTDIPLFAPNANGVQQPVPDGNGGQAVEHGGSVYGLVGDSQGYLYAAGLWESRGLLRFNANTDEWDAYYTGFNCAVYGIAVDGKNRIWMGCSDDSWGPFHDTIGGGLAMFDPATQKVTRFYVPNGLGNTLPAWGDTSDVTLSCPTNTDCDNRWRISGLAVEPATGDVWATVRNLGYMIRLELDENDLTQSEWTFVPVLRDEVTNEWLPNIFIPNHGTDMRGIGFDNAGYVWHLGMATMSVFRIEPVALDREYIALGTGGHYTYSDFTGSTAFSFTAPRGFWRYYFDTGFPNAQLDGFEWEAHVPVNTTMGLRVRALDTNNNPISGWLPAEDYFEYPTNANQDVIDLHQHGGPLIGATFEVELRMTSSDPNIRPILYELELEWQRP